MVVSEPYECCRWLVMAAGERFVSRCQTGALPSTSPRAVQLLASNPQKHLRVTPPRHTADRDVSMIHAVADHDAAGIGRFADHDAAGIGRFADHDAWVGQGPPLLNRPTV